MKVRELQKSQFHNRSVNWGIFRSTVLANIQKLKFWISSMNWENLRSPTRATIKKLNFQTLCEMRKT